MGANRNPSIFTGSGPDPAHPSGHRALVDDLEHADIAGIGDMGAAAELDRIGERLARQGAAHRQHPHLVAVFLAEHGDGAAGDRVLLAHQLGFDRGVGADAVVDRGLDRG